MPHHTDPAPLDWPDEVLQLFRTFAVRQVAYVPDAGLTRLIELCQNEADIAAVSLTSEQEGVAMLAGAWLGGQRGALLMQSSGVGNCINMLGMINECRFPLLMIVTMRGEWGEFNPWQVPMGQAAARVLEAAGVIVHRAEGAAEVSVTVEASAKLAFEADRAVAVLIAQRVIGFKRWDK